ncbi:MAG: hypothetical protein V3R33_05925, partial [Anaerolineales bacterium]
INRSLETVLLKRNILNTAAHGRFRHLKLHLWHFPDSSRLESQGISPDLTGCDTRGLPNRRPGHPAVQRRAYFLQAAWGGILPIMVYLSLSGVTFLVGLWKSRP